MTTGIRAVGPGLDELFDELTDVETYTPAAAQAVREHLRQTTAAGTSSSGKPWAPRQSDGSKPLQHAFEAIEVRAAGDEVIVELKGHHVFPHYGAKGHPVREIIPKEIDERLGDAVRRGVVKPWKDRT